MSAAFSLSFKLHQHNPGILILHIILRCTVRLIKDETPMCQRFILFFAVVFCSQLELPVNAQIETYPRRFIVGAGVQFLGVLAPMEKNAKNAVTPYVGYSVEFGVLSKDKKNALILAPLFGTVLFKKPIWIVTDQGEIRGVYHYKPGMLSIPLNYRRAFAIGKRAGIEIGGGVAYNLYSKSLTLETYTADTLFHTSTATTPFTNHFSFHLLADYVYHFRWKSAISIGITAGMSAGNDEKYPILTIPFDYATVGLNTRYLF